VKFVAQRTDENRSLDTAFERAWRCERPLNTR
jgi:hypothetical protein